MQPDARGRAATMAMVLSSLALHARTAHANIRALIFLAMVSSWLPCASASSAALPIAPVNLVRYPASEVTNDERGSYYASLLKLVLAKSNSSIEAEPTEEASGIKRAFARMAAGDGVDVMWAPATRQLDREFLRVPVPLDNGILGWRLFLVRQQDSERFRSVGSLEELKARPAGQVAEWIDTDILRFNGLPVVPSMRYQDLFNMLTAQRFSYLPRGIGEIQDEAKDYAPQGIQIEPHLALYYPMCAYFYVARRNTLLAAQLEDGLKLARKDGSLERLFRQANGASIQAAGLSKRLVLELDNPFAPNGPGSGHEECAAAAGVVRSMR